MANETRDSMVTSPQVFGITATTEVLVSPTNEVRLPDGPTSIK